LGGDALKPETYFLRYAFPCIFVKKLRGEITNEEIAELERVVVNSEDVDRKLLEEVFAVASEQLDKIALELGKEKWSMEVLKEYFLVRHNDFVDTREGLPGKTLKELCKIREGEIVEDFGEIVKVKYGERYRNVSKDFFPSVKVGDNVRIHYAYIVEVL
jgi:hypothetical protein